MKYPFLINVVFIGLHLFNVRGEVFENKRSLTMNDQNRDTNPNEDIETDLNPDHPLGPTPIQAPPCLPDCHCSISSIICNATDTFQGLHSFHPSNHIFSIMIRNQVSMTHFNLDQLKIFPHLRSLEISNSGLKWITGESSFCHYPINTVNLSNNQLATMPWKTIGYCHGVAVTLKGNPLVCNCTLSHFIDHHHSRGITCMQEDNIKLPLVIFLQQHTCDMPIAKLKLKQNGNFGFKADSTEARSPNFEIFDLEPTIQVMCQLSARRIQNAKVFWLRVQKGVIEDTAKIAKNNTSVGIIERKNRSILKLRKADATSNGLWVCMVEDQIYYAQVILNLTVHSAPVISHFEQFQNEDFYMLHYSVKAWPLPNITWVYHNSTHLHTFHYQPDDTDLISESRSAGIEWTHNKVSSYEVEGSFLIKKASKKHNGLYTLRAENIHGLVTKSYYVNESGEEQEYANRSLSLDHSLQGTMEANKNKLVTKEAKVLMLFLGCLSMLLAMVVIVLVVRRKYCSQRAFKRHHQQHHKLNCTFTHPSQDNRNKICIFYQNKKYKNNEKRFKSIKSKNSMGKLLSFCFVDRQTKHHKELIRLENVEENPSYDKSLWDHLDLCLLSTVPKISHERIECLQKLGEGAFGLVHLGVMSTKAVEEKDVVYVPVALKTFKENGMKNLHVEASTLMGLSHPNVVALHGVCIDKFPPTLVLEYMPLGDLNKFIRARSPDADLVQTKTCSDRYFRYKNVNDTNFNIPKNKNNDVNNNIPTLHSQPKNFNSLNSKKEEQIFEQMKQLKDTKHSQSFNRALEHLCNKDDTYSILSQRELLQISLQISQGAAYLASRRFVHRDLATRNCLVGSNLVVKIGDFGMSRDVYSTDYYRVGSEMMMPIRWMPPESIMYRTFTLESDVWSVGVVLWEVFSYGKQPWYEFTNTQVVQHLLKGHVMFQPSCCPAAVYQLMKRCWCKQPKERIKMEELARQLESIATFKKH